MVASPRCGEQGGNATLTGVYALCAFCRSYPALSRPGCYDHITLRLCLRTIRYSRSGSALSIGSGLPRIACWVAVWA